jgi:hypothetical protein
MHVVRIELMPVLEAARTYIFHNRVKSVSVVRFYIAFGTFVFDADELTNSVSLVL